MAFLLEIVRNSALYIYMKKLM